LGYGWIRFIFLFDENFAFKFFKKLTFVVYRSVVVDPEIVTVVVGRISFHELVIPGRIPFLG
jgi:hypothetical protein